MYCPECGVTVVKGERCPACGHRLGDEGPWSPTEAERRLEAAAEPADPSGLRWVSRLAVDSAAGLVALALVGTLPVVPVDAAVALGTDSPTAVVVAAVLFSAGLLVRTGFRPTLYGTTLLFAALLGLAAAALASAGVVAFLAGTVAGVIAVWERRATGSTSTADANGNASVHDCG